MDDRDDSYIDLLLNSSLKIKKGDIISINTNPEDIGFATSIASKAREITGNGSYIQYIENGKITEREEVGEKYKIDKEPTVFIHIPAFRDRNDVDFDRIYGAKELQEYGLLSEPLEYRKPSIPYINAYHPNSSYLDLLDIDEEDLYRELDELLYLSSINPVRINESKKELLLEIQKSLNQMRLIKCTIKSIDSELSLSFIPGSLFFANIEKTAKGRVFIPSIVPNVISRAVVRSSVNGKVKISRPFVLFNEECSNLTLYYEKGVLTSYEADEYTLDLFELYLKQDPNAAFISSLSLSNRRESDFLFHVKDFDESNGPMITLGGTKPSLIEGIHEDLLVDSFVTLNLPIDDFSLNITAEDIEGNESIIYKDGSFNSDLIDL